MGEIICKALPLVYENKSLIENLSFEVKKGDYLCIVGENGTGKSTLMRTILRLQKPMSGSIEYSDGLKSTEIGYLPQQTLVQRDFPASVKEVVISGCQAKTGIRPFYSKEEKALAAKNMERLGIDNLAKRCYRELSGGQQQRVLLARALCATEKMLLLDVPVSGLDPKVTADMYKMIKKLNDDGISIIMISHDIYSAVKYASHILHIGNDTFFGTVEEYRKTKLGKLYLDEEGGKDNA